MKPTKENYLESKLNVVDADAVCFDKVCIWYKIIHNPESSTRYHIHKDHNLYPCYNVCSGIEYKKNCYKTIKYK